MKHEKHTVLIDSLAAVLFPFQESEEEQESFTDVGRRRVDEWLDQHLKEAAEAALFALTEKNVELQKAAVMYQQLAVEAEETLSAHREAVERVRRASLATTAELPEQLQAALEELHRLAALASPRQVEQEDDKNDDHTRVVESSQPDRAALPQRPTS